MNSIPPEIIEAATTVRNWMEMHGHSEWELAGVCSRSVVSKSQAREAQLWGELTKANADKAELLDRLIERCRDYTTHAAKELDKLRAIEKDAEALVLTLTNITNAPFSWDGDCGVVSLAQDAIGTYTAKHPKP